MILRAIRGLSENDELRHTLQERYQYPLLDEFQDTNAAQLRLVELLTDNPVHEGRPNVLAVGDDDRHLRLPGRRLLAHAAVYQYVPRRPGGAADPKLPLTRGSLGPPSQQISGQIETRLHHNFPAFLKT